MREINAEIVDHIAPVFEIQTGKFQIINCLFDVGAIRRQKYTVVDVKEEHIFSEIVETIIA